jgi:DNA-binding transcriptional MerR regulator
MGSPKQKSPKHSAIADTVQVSERFKTLLIGYFNFKEAVEISHILNKRTKEMKAGIATHRQISNWSRDGLLHYEKNGDEWRRYSIMEALWVHLIHRLRQFGYTIEQIKKIKNSLSKESNVAKVPMPMLEFCVSEALARKEPYVLLVFDDGSAIPISYHDFKINITDYELNDHIYISLNRILQHLLPNSKLNPINKLEYYPSKKEFELLSFIKKGDFERIEIKFKGKKMETLKATERLDFKKHVTEVLKEKEYQTMQVIRKGGKIVSIVRDYTVKLPDDK